MQARIVQRNLNMNRLSLDAATTVPVSMSQMHNLIASPLHHHYGAPLELPVMHGAGTTFNGINIVLPVATSSTRRQPTRRIYDRYVGRLAEPDSHGKPRYAWYRDK